MVGGGGVGKGLNDSSVPTEQGIYDWIDTGTIWYKWWRTDGGTEWNLEMLLHLKIDFSLNIVSLDLKLIILIYFGPFGWIIHTDALKFIANLASDLFLSQYCDWKRIDIIFFGVTFAFKEAEKLKSHKMKDEGGWNDWF